VRKDKLDAAWSELARLEVLGNFLLSKAFGIRKVPKKELLDVVMRVLYRQRAGLDHGLHVTTIEEIIRQFMFLDRLGQVEWNLMKAKAGEMWLPNLEVDLRNRESFHVGGYFIDHLVNYAEGHSGFKVDLVGHSAGSIAICELLKAISKYQSPLKFSRIALLAPAVRLDIFHQEVVCHPDRFEQFRMFIMLDEFERQDAIAWKFYPYSLVYFVSGVLEHPAGTPISGLDLYITRRLGPYDSTELHEVHDYFSDDPMKNRLVRSITDPSAERGLRSDSTHHGDFDNATLINGQLPQTIDSLQFFLKH